jgi:GT2 family glycosyltransferase
MAPRVAVQLVTYNSREDLPGCLGSLADQSFRDFEIRVLDNASRDGTPHFLQQHRAELAALEFAPANLGFAAAHNRLLAGHAAEYVLFLNPDTELAADFLARAVDRLVAHPECGSLSAKLWRLDAMEETRARTRVLDSTGMYWLRNQRHLDRGGGEPDVGQYDRTAYVFGATGAAALYRRACLDDVAVEGEIWDEDFFLYREDAELAWRAGWRGWRCIYDPGVTAWHVRRVVPENRRRTDSVANMHSVKNRFLMRLKDMPFATYVRWFIPITLRDLAVAGYIPLREPRSLRAFWLLARLGPRFMVKRRQVFARAVATRDDMERWFRVAELPLQENVN